MDSQPGAQGAVEHGSVIATALVGRDDPFHWSCHRELRAEGAEFN